MFPNLMRRRHHIPKSEHDYKLAYNVGFVCGRDDALQGKDFDPSSYRGDPAKMAGYTDGYEGKVNATTRRQQ